MLTFQHFFFATKRIVCELMISWEEVEDIELVFYTTNIIPMTTTRKIKQQVIVKQLKKMKTPMSNRK